MSEGIEVPYTLNPCMNCSVSAGQSCTCSLHSEKKCVKFSKLFLTLFRPSLDEVSWPFWSHLGLNEREDFDIALAFTWHSNEFFKILLCFLFVTICL